MLDLFSPAVKVRAALFVLGWKLAERLGQPPWKEGEWQAVVLKEHAAVARTFGVEPSRLLDAFCERLILDMTWHSEDERDVSRETP